MFPQTTSDVNVRNTTLGLSCTDGYEHCHQQGPDLPNEVCSYPKYQSPEVCNLQYGCNWDNQTNACLHQVQRWCIRREDQGGQSQNEQWEMCGSIDPRVCGHEQNFCASLATKYDFWETNQILWPSGISAARPSVDPYREFTIDPSWMAPVDSACKHDTSFEKMQAPQNYMNTRFPVAGIPDPQDPSLRWTMTPGPCD